ncbi:MAG: hypothetical protein P8Y18_03865 [Candidatus Bathyarchaeota archaeon]
MEIASKGLTLGINKLRGRMTEESIELEHRRRGNDFQSVSI